MRLGCGLDCQNESGNDGGKTLREPTKFHTMFAMRVIESL